LLLLLSYHLDATLLEINKSFPFQKKMWWTSTQVAL